MAVLIEILSETDLLTTKHRLERLLHIITLGLNLSKKIFGVLHFSLNSQQCILTKIQESYNISAKVLKEEKFL